MKVYFRKKKYYMIFDNCSLTILKKIVSELPLECYITRARLAGSGKA
jgi:hypothetical protein